MMEPGSGESAGTDAEPVIPSGAVAEEVSGEAGRKDTPPEPEDPVRRRTSGRQRRASLEEYRETYREHLAAYRDDIEQWRKI